jgi:hypothetical protein
MPDVVSRQIAIAIALLAALGVLVAAMAVSTAARGQEPEGYDHGAEMR